jgi:hypothetical protein
MADRGGGPPERLASAHAKPEARGCCRPRGEAAAARGHVPAKQQPTPAPPREIGWRQQPHQTRQTSQVRRPVDGGCVLWRIASRSNRHFGRRATARRGAEHVRPAAQTRHQRAQWGHQAGLRPPPPQSGRSRRRGRRVTWVGIRNGCARLLQSCISRQRCGSRRGIKRGCGCLHRCGRVGQGGRSAGETRGSASATDASGFSQKEADICRVASLRVTVTVSVVSWRQNRSCSVPFTPQRPHRRDRRCNASPSER